MKPGPPPDLVTERFILRQYTDTDFERMYKMRSNKTVMDLIQQEVQTEDEVRDKMKKHAESNLDGSALIWIIADKLTDEMLGGIGYYRINWDHYRGEIGYALLEECFGKGIATETAKAVVKYAFTQTKLHTIFGNVNIENKASQNVLLKLGFSKEAQLRENYHQNGKFSDTLVFGMLKSEWLATQQ